MFHKVSALIWFAFELPLISAFTYSHHAFTPCDATLKRNGAFTCVAHNVTTSDGFIITAYRITSSTIGNANLKSPVMLQHGLVLELSDRCRCLLQC